MHESRIDLDGRWIGVQSVGHRKPAAPTVTAMSEAHKRSYRHPKYKTAYHVRNWAAYEKALRDRGDVTLWLSQDAIDAWTPPETGKPGGQPLYSNIAIETALTLRLVFHLALRGVESDARIGSPSIVSG